MAAYFDFQNHRSRQNMSVENLHPSRWSSNSFTACTAAESTAPGMDAMVGDGDDEAEPLLGQESGIRAQGTITDVQGRCAEDRAS